MSVVAEADRAPGQPAGPGVLGSSLAVLLARVGGGGAAFLLNVLLARILGVRGVGLYFLATTVSAFAIIVGRAGQENVVLRFAAIAHERAEWDRLGAIRRGSRRLALAASLAVSLALLLSAPFLATTVFRSPDLAPLLRILALAVPLTGLATLDIQMVRASGRVRLAAVLEALPSPGFSILAVLPLALAYGLVGAAWGAVAAAALVLVTVLAVAHRLVRGLGSRAGAFDGALLLRTGLPLLWVGLSGMVLGMTDTVMLGVFADARQVGLYGAAARAAGIASTALAAVSTVVAPRFAALHADGRNDELSSLAREATGRAILMALPVLGLCLALPGTVLSIFGPEFRVAAPALVILGLGHGVNVVTGPVGQLLAMSGRERILRNNVLGAGALNVALNLALVPPLGALGAAIATAVSMVLVNLLSLMQVRRHLGFSVLPRRRASRHA